MNKRNAACGAWDTAATQQRYRRSEKKVKEGAHLFNFSVIRDFDNQTSQYRENSSFLMFWLWQDLL